MKKEISVNHPNYGDKAYEELCYDMFTVYKDNHNQKCPMCNVSLTTQGDYFGGGSHYWSLKCEICNTMFDYDTYAFELRRI